MCKKHFDKPDILNSKGNFSDNNSDELNAEDIWYDYEHPENCRTTVSSINNTADSKRCSCTCDMVNHPTHYTNSSIECIDALTAMIENWDDCVDASLSWQVVKYVWRHPFKFNGLEDLKKAQFYLNRLVNYLENKN